LKWALVAFAIGLALRIALAGGDLRRDELRILRAAENRTATAQVMPLWPMTLAVGGRATAIVFSSLTIVLAWLLVRRLADERTAAVVAFALAIDLDLAVLGGSVLSEPLYGFLLVAFALAWVRERTVLAAALCGLAALTRPEAVLIPIAFAAWNREWRRPALLAAGVAIALAPWAARNAHVFDAFIPLTTNGGVTLWAGHNPADADAPFRKRGQGRGVVFDEIGTETRRDRAYRARAIDYATAYPGETAVTTLAKTAITFTPLQRKGRSWLWATMTLAFGWALVRRPRLRTPLLGPLLCVMALICVVFLAIPRYRAPYHPFFYAFAAAGLLHRPDPEKKNPDSLSRSRAESV